MLRSPSTASGIAAGSPGGKVGLICRNPWTSPELVLTCSDRVALFHEMMERSAHNGGRVLHYKEMFPDDSMDWPQSYRVGIS